jgi:hypothetical protein
VLPVTARALQQKGERERGRTRERGGGGEREVLINWFIDNQEVTEGRQPRLGARGSVQGLTNKQIVENGGRLQELAVNWHQEKT